MDCGQEPTSAPSTGPTNNHPVYGGEQAIHGIFTGAAHNPDLYLTHKHVSAPSTVPTSNHSIHSGQQTTSVPSTGCTNNHSMWVDKKLEVWHLLDLQTIMPSILDKCKFCVHMLFA